MRPPFSCCHSPHPLLSRWSDASEPSCTRDGGIVSISAPDDARRLRLWLLNPCRRGDAQEAAPRARLEEVGREEARHYTAKGAQGGGVTAGALSAFQ